MNLYPIPYDFIDKNIELSWDDIKWGYENNFIASEVPIKKAEKEVLTGNYTDSELELSFIMTGESGDIECYLNKICADFEQKNDSIIKRKWLFIVLCWLWFNRDNYEEPLDEIENIYADFEYPYEIEGFVKYMPPSDGYDPSVHTQQENLSRLMHNWKSYLEKESALFKI